MVVATTIGILAAVGQFGAWALLAVTDAPVNTINLAFTGVGATAVVSVMAWIVKKVVSGEVGPVPIQNLLAENKAIIGRLDRRNDELEKENKELRELIRSGTEAQFAMHEYLRVNTRQDPPLPARVYPKPADS